MGGPALIDKTYYYEFDTYYLSSFEENEIVYKSVEHYYQAKKVVDEKIQQVIREAENGHDAWSLGRMYPIRKGWEKTKAIVMLEANKLKFDQNENIKQMLVNTDGNIVFPDADEFWRDMLGKILMILRAYYKGENRSMFELEKYFNFHIDLH